MKEEKNGGLVPQEQALKPVLQIIYEEADQRVQIMRGLFEKSLKITKKHDWMLQGKGERAKPYLKSDAACQLADFFKFEYFDLEYLPMERVKHKEGPDELLFTIVGKCRIPGLGVQPVMGSSSTRDDLYSKRSKDGKSYYLELHDISLPKVRNKSLTNFLGNGPRHRLNLINITIEEFERMTGFKAEKLADSVEYKGGSGKKRELTPENQTKLEEIKKMAIYLTQGSAELEGELLLSVTANPTKGFSGTSDYNRLSDAQVSWIHREYEKRQKKQMEMEANPPGAKS
jgi:hypothetical protein